MSGFLRTVGQVASVVATVAAFIPGGQPIALAASAVALTANVGAQLTARKPVNERQGAQLDFTISPGAPIPYIMGRTAVGGTMVYQDTYGKDSSYKTFFTVLSGGGPVDAVETFLADRAAVPFSNMNAVGYYRNWMWQDAQVGLTPEPDALSNGIISPPYGFAGTPPGWGASSKLSGYAAASLSLLYDTKARRYANGEPKPGWIVRGVKVYDPRLDSTYPGGSGPCRWADPSDTAAHAAARATWVYSVRPALHGLMWRLGVWQRDESNPSSKYQKLMGIGAPIDMIDLPAIVQAANVQDANGWSIGGQIDSSQDKWEVLKLIEQTGGCEPLSNGALMSTLVKAPRVSLRTITAADLADGKLSAPGMRAKSDRINGYRARFRSEAHGWEITAIDIVQVPDYVAADGRAKTGSGDFSLCPDPDQCAELAAYEVFDSRELEPISLPLKPLFMGYRLGDCLTIDIPELGLERLDVVIRGRTVDPGTAIVTLTFRSETAAKHPAALGLTGATPPTPTLTAPPDSIAAPVVGDWQIVAPSATGGVVTPTIAIAGTVGNSNADAVIFEYRLHVDGMGVDDGWSNASLNPPTTNSYEFTGLLSATQYDVSIRYRGRSILSDRLILGPVTAATIEPGRDGVPGAPGVDGRTSYVHYAYADSLDGTVRFTIGAPEGRAFVGTYTDFLAADGGDPAAYQWTQYAGPPGFGLAASGDVVVAGAKLVKRATGAGWGSGGGYSTEGWKNGAQASWTIDTASADIMAGLNTDPAANNSYETIDYAWYMANDNGADIYESGAYVGRAGAYTPGTRFQINYDGKYVRYYLDGVLFREVIAAANLTMYFDAAFAGIQSSISGIGFSASGAAGVDGAPGTRGDDGLPGAPGANGVSSYTAYAYANSPDGSVDFTTGEPGMRGYIGVSANLTTATEPTSPAAYTWSLYRGPVFGVGTRGGAVVIGNTVLKSYASPGVGTGWDADAFSTSSYTGAASVSFILTGNTQIMAGLNTDPLTDASYGSIDFAFYRDANDNLLAFENSAVAANFGGPYDDTTRLRIDYDGERVTYFIGDAPRRQVRVGPGVSYYFDSSIVSEGRIQDLSFSGGSRTTASVTLVADTPSTFVSGNEIRSMPPEGGWGSVHAHSVESFARGAVAQWTIPAGSGGQNAMIGLGQAQHNGDSFEGITFAIFQQSDGYVDARVNGNGIIAGPVVNTGVDNNYKLHFDGETVRYFANGVQFGTFPWGRQPDPLYFVAAMASSNPRATNITFTAAGTNGTDGRDGLNGNNGAPGAPGANGQSSYLHIAYSNSPDGYADFTTGAPGGRMYLGTLVDQTLADSTNPAAYRWSLVKGADGLNGTNGTPGAPGANGQPTYIHIAYSNSADGYADFSLDNPAGRTYVGFYVDQQVADSGNPAAYAWSLVKGTDGVDGAPGPQGPQGPPGADGAAGQALLSDGAATINIANSGTGTTVVVSSAISVPAGGKFRLTLAGADPVNNTGGAFFGARVMAIVNFANGTSQTLFDKNAFLNSDGELNDANLLAASSNLIANASAGAATLVIQHTRSGQSGNSGSFRLSYVLERL